MAKEKVDLGSILPGPVRHESLPPELLEQIKNTYDTVGRYVHKTLEQWETTFMRDMHPEREVAIWLFISAVWQEYQERYANEVLSDDEKRKIVGDLVAASLGVDVSELKTSPEMRQRLVNCWNDVSRRQ